MNKILKEEKRLKREKEKQEKEIQEKERREKERQEKERKRKQREKAKRERKKKLEKQKKRKKKKERENNQTTEDLDLLKMRLFSVMIIDINSKPVKCVPLHIGNGRIRLLDPFGNVHKRIITQSKFFFERKPQMLSIGDVLFAIKFENNQQRKEFVQIMKLEKSRPIPESENIKKQTRSKSNNGQKNNFTLKILNSKSKIVANAKLRINQKQILLTKIKKKNEKKKNYKQYIHHIKYNHLQKKKTIGKIHFVKLNKKYFIKFINQQSRTNFKKIFLKYSFLGKQKFKIEIIDKANDILDQGSIITNNGKIKFHLQKKSYVSTIHQIKYYKHKTIPDLARININNIALNVKFEDAKSNKKFSSLTKFVCKNMKNVPLVIEQKKPVPLKKKNSPILKGQSNSPKSSESPNLQKKDTNIVGVIVESNIKKLKKNENIKIEIQESKIVFIKLDTKKKKKVKFPISNKIRIDINNQNKKLSKISLPKNKFLIIILENDKIAHSLYSLLKKNTKEEN
ncbi:hypothetical protein M0812_17809 [Anaeramoeba flamelloides]|uniref:Uncharacterized protein n=1 Tax=Anaeramoeba flamelloides TaxID=1746091 RepID=A0AAV7Z3W8_9EUKA|nr:hypothetical protein M0812_17809 [Anaeramoeba flamelloides]